MDENIYLKYGALAQIYDEFMGFVSYDSWVELIQKLCAEHGFAQDVKILEIGGGTGFLGRKLINSGFLYQGSDLSFAMTKAAKSKGLDFVCADSRNLPFNGKFNIILFLFDGINYLFEPQDFKKTFEEVHRLLDKGGLFLFDITTQENSQRNFLNYREALCEKTFAYVRESYYDPQNSVQHNDFDIFIRLADGNYGRFNEKHKQKIYPVRDICGFIPKNLFETLGIWGDFKRKKYTKKSERVHFLLHKK